MTTFLGAHALPPEADGDKDRYHRRGLRHDPGRSPASGSPTRSMRSAKASRSRPSRPRGCSRPRKAHGLPVKLHADQLSNLHGAGLAAEYGALSADHLEYTDEDGVAAMAQAGTVAVLLPGAFYVAAGEATAAGRGVPQAWRADRDRDRQQPRHIADHVVADWS